MGLSGRDLDGRASRVLISLLGVAFSTKLGSDRVGNDLVFTFDFAVGFTPRLGLARRQVYSTG